MIDENKKVFENKDDIENITTKAVKNKIEANYKKGRNLFLSKEELKTISENKMLKNYSISAAQSMLKNSIIPLYYTGCMIPLLIAHASLRSVDRGTICAN